MILTCAMQGFICMTVDAAVTRYADGEYDFEVGTKAIPLRGSGIVSTWGQRTGNRILRWSFIPPHVSGVHDLVTRVDDFVQLVAAEQDTAPTDEIGFHIAGFDSEGRAHLHHVCFAVPIPARGPNAPVYQRHDHSPTAANPIQLLYNGRNDIAHGIIQALLRDAHCGKPVGFDLSDPIGLVRFGDFVARTAAELTPEVGPPFTTYLFAPDNRYRTIVNGSNETLPEGQVKVALDDLFGQSGEMVDRGWSEAGLGDHLYSVVLPGEETLSVASVVEINPYIEIPTGTATAVVGFSFRQRR